MTPTVIENLKKHVERPFDHHETMKVLQHKIAVYWSWGVEKLSVLTEKKETVGLVLKVNGHFHSGYVMISLNWSDTYRVVIVTTLGTILDVYEEVYVDELMKVIDNRIEKIEDYTY